MQKTLRTLVFLSILIILAGCGHLAGCSHQIEDQKLGVAGHTLEVYAQKCFAEQAKTYKGPDAIEYFYMEAKEACHKQPIDFITEGYIYVFIFDLINPKSNAEIADIQIIGSVDGRHSRRINRQSSNGESAYFRSGYRNIPHGGRCIEQR